jgi:hypothetical protein
MTRADFDAMVVAQDNRCALCGAEFLPWPNVKHEPNVDHDHTTGRVRGLLCARCNATLGTIEKSTPEWWAAAERYIGGPFVGRAVGHSAAIYRGTPGGIAEESRKRAAGIMDDVFGEGTG